MTARVFKRIAERVGMIADGGIRAKLAIEFADVFADENPRFDRSRFYEAVRQTAEAEYGVDAWGAVNELQEETK